MDKFRAACHAEWDSTDDYARYRDAWWEEFSESLTDGLTPDEPLLTHDEWERSALGREAHQDYVYALMDEE